MEIRDPVHGFVEYDETEERIINSGIFQRLRNINQLALASAVYPGAHHTRFEHCIGTMHLAGKVAHKLCLDDNRRHILRLTALLHDIGHGPFSHVSEQIMEKYAGDLVKKYKAENSHELISILLIRKHPDLIAILNAKEVEAVVGLLQKQAIRSIEKEIISGPLDVDKLDYLLRDSYFAGVKYGLFDLEKVIQSFEEIDISRKGRTLGISQEGIYAVEQLLLAKYHMNAQVYQHRIRRITDAMLVRGIELGIKTGMRKLTELFHIHDSKGFIEKYENWNDRTLTELMLKNSTGAALEYFRRTRERKLLKEVFSIKIDNVSFSDGVLFESIKHISEIQIQELAREAAHIFSDSNNTINPEMVIIDKQTISNPTFKTPGVKIDSNTIMVKTKTERKPFTEVSSVFRNNGIDPDIEMLYIYLPLDWLENKNERIRYITEHRDRMFEKIKEIVR